MTPRQSRRHLSVLLGGVAVLLVGAAWLPGAAVAHASDVHGDDERDRYVGTGGLVLPASVDHGTRAMVAGCTDCRWRLATPCFRSSAGAPFDGQSPCLSTSRGCGLGRQLLRSWFQQGGSPWREIGLVCMGESPITVADAGRDAHDRLVRDLAPPVTRRQPAAAVVTQIPVIFDSGQHAGMLRADYDLAGERVTLTAVPAWQWDFGDGTVVTTVDPGGRFPHDAVAHTYRRAGAYRVRMTTAWSAHFTIAGLGPFEVPEPVTQSAAIDLPVGEGRAVLAVR